MSGKHSCKDQRCFYLGGYKYLHSKGYIETSYIHLSNIISNIYILYTTVSLTRQYNVDIRCLDRRKSYTGLFLSVLLLLHLLHQKVVNVPYFINQNNSEIIELNTFCHTNTFSLSIIFSEINCPVTILIKPKFCSQQKTISKVITCLAKGSHFQVNHDTTEKCFTAHTNILQPRLQTAL